MGFHDRAVDQIQTVARFRCQRVKNPLPDATSRPTIEAIVSRCVGPIAFRQIAPRHPRAQHVKYRVHDLAIISASALSSFRHQRLQKSPFVIAQIKSHDPPPTTVNHDHFDFSRNYVGTDPSVSDIKAVLWEEIRFDGYCPNCRRWTTSDRSSAGTRLSGYSDNYYKGLVQLHHISFRCARNDEHFQNFYCIFQTATLQKIGQWPSFADIAIDESKQYSALLDRTDTAEFHKAIGLAAHGVGIGSFVYLRRIFERLIEKRYREFRDVEEWSDEDLYKLRMVEKIQHLSAHLPEFLVKNAKIYSILSVGLHELEEKECLEFFPVLRQSTIWILDQDKKKQEELRQQQALEKAIAGFGTKTIISQSDTTT